MALPALISARILPAALRLLFASLRLSVEPRGFSLPEPGYGCLFAFWHGDMAVGWLLSRRLFGQRPNTAVVSRSKDGAILSDTLGAFGFRLIRGSSSKGGGEVRAAMTKALLEGGVVTLTPDGPRGPAGQFKYGTVRIASETGRPLIFATVRFSGGRRLNSWDRFMIPRPFSNVTVVLQHIDVPRFGSEEELRHYSEQLPLRLGHA
ncbi:lysophospholipid acyltransferase family protein [Chlorobium sp. N1]|uniref:lysophospholipid acyltransferase family protein n=1 Tax=Chlorobium sp. N1 TaxID=2491138 RepID=UPI00103DF4BF|nr:lysophospholipid acyltransferase family protein [Chlorobium sp. N1]TCD48779.1 DUF374 domain-containing protein [Chlorobium sp. N1]